MRSIASRMSVMSGEGALSVFARAKELEAKGRSIIHLELGEPDFHPGKSVIDSAAKALADGKDRYCAVAGVPALREEIAAYLQRTRNISVSPANIVLAPGCKIALFLGMMALLEPGDEVLYPDPGFPGYPSITLGLGRGSRAVHALGAQSFSAGPGGNRVQNHAAHAHADHEFPGQSDGNRLYRRRAARPGRTRGQARPVGALRRNLRAHYLWRRISFHAALSRHAGAHADHRRILQELCHDRMAAGIHGRSARGCVRRC